MPGETRKVQKTGVATYTISLPKVWVRKHSVNAGDALSILEGKDGTLAVGFHDFDTTPTTKTIDMDMIGDEALVRKLLAECLNGADVIKLSSAKGISGRRRNVILEQIKRLISFEIVEEDTNNVIIQDFFSADHLSIPKALKRAFAITNLMLKDMLRMLESGDRSTAKNIIELENEVDRLNFLVRRQLGKAIQSSAILKGLELSTSDALSYAFIIRDIENITDHLTKTAEHALKLKQEELTPALKKNLIEMNSILLDIFATTTKAVFNRDFKLANDVLDLQGTIKAKRDEISREISALNTPTALVAEAVFTNMLSVMGHISAIAEVAIDRA